MKKYTLVIFIYFNDAGQGMRCGSHGVRALPVIDILDRIILQE